MVRDTVSGTVTREVVEVRQESPELGEKKEMIANGITVNSSKQQSNAAAQRTNFRFGRRNRNPLRCRFMF